MIRAYEPADEADVLGVWYRASIIAHGFLPNDFFESEGEMLRDVFLPSSDTFVYEHDGRVAGFLSLASGCEVGGLFVDPHLQRRGIARALMDHVAENCDEIELEVFEQNSLARSFYQAYGFSSSKIVVDDHTGHKAIRMRWVRT